MARHNSKLFICVFFAFLLAVTPHPPQYLEALDLTWMENMLKGNENLFLSKTKQNVNNFSNSGAAKRKLNLFENVQRQRRRLTIPRQSILSKSLKGFIKKKNGESKQITILSCTEYLKEALFTEHGRNGI